MCLFIFGKPAIFRTVMPHHLMSKRKSTENNIMLQTCDLYIPHVLDDYSPLEYLHIFEPNFIYEPEKSYQGYLNVNVRRIVLVNFIVEFRKRKMQIYNVPTQYRDHKNLSIDQAFEYALKKIDLEKYHITNTSIMGMDSPVVWHFPLSHLLEEKAGVGISVDKLNGHIWTMDEIEEYGYDFNNLL
jgi:hypothetical protein